MCGVICVSHPPTNQPPNLLLGGRRVVVREEVVRGEEAHPTRSCHAHVYVKQQMAGQRVVVV